MGWTFLWLMVALKVPIAALLYIVWWAVHSTDEEPAGDGSGGSGVRPPQRPRGRRRWPRTRGPHGAPASSVPVPRTRVAVHAHATMPDRHVRKTAREGGGVNRSQA